MRASAVLRASALWSVLLAMTPAAIAQQTQLFSPALLVEEAAKKYPAMWAHVDGDRNRIRHKPSGMVCASGHQSYILVDVTTGGNGAGCAWATPDQQNKNFTVSVEPLKGQTIAQLSKRLVTEMESRGIKVTTPPHEIKVGGCPAMRVTFLRKGTAVGGTFLAIRRDQMWTVGFFALGTDRVAGQNGAQAEMEAKAYLANTLTC